MATVIGTVTKISGMAIVVDANGNRHMLKKGDALHAGDKVITASGDTVLVKLTNGETVNIAEGQTVKMTDHLAQVDVSDVTENTVNQAIFDAVLTALNEGRDVTEVLQDPAAGIAGSDGNATFVNLERIKTANADLNRYDSNGGNGGGDGQNGFKANYVYFQTASDAPVVSLLGDADDNGYLNANELNGSSTTIARIDFPAGVQAGDTVNVTHNGGTIAVVVKAADIAKGYVDVSIPVPAEGTKLVVAASVTNQSGQTSPSGSDSAIVDTKSPDAESISGQLPETKVDDTGASQTDNITSNKEPTLTGTTEKSTDTVVVTINGKDYTATVTDDGSGKGVWTVALTGANLSDGNYTPSITVTDLAGNTTTKASETFTVDATAPDSASISGQLPETKVDDTGASQTDNITSNKEPTLTGTTEKSTDTVVVTINGKDYTATVTDDGSGKGVWTVALTGANLSDGSYTPSITVTDLAGNSTTKASETFTIDSTAPDTPAFIGHDDIGTITGQIVNNSTIDDDKPEIKGTGANPGDVITIFDAGKEIGTALVDEKGNWTFTPTTPLDEGEHVITTTATDPAGNTSQESDSLTFTVDVTPPAVAISLDADVAGDGVVNLVESTTAAIPVTGTVSGAFKVGDTVTVTVNGKDFTTTVQSGGKFSVNVPGADLAADSDKTVEAKVTTTDSAGNSTTASDTQTYAVNTTPPAVAISLDADVAGDGVVNLVESTTAAIPVTGTVSGAFKVGDTVTVTVNGKDFTTTVQSGGKFSVNVPGADLAADSDKTVEAKVTTTDSAGNSTTASDTQTYAVNTTPPAVAISLDADVAGDGVVNLVESTTAAIPVTGTVSGAFKVGDTVTVTVNGKDFTTTVQSGGKFSVNVPGADLAADSDKTVEAKVTTTDSAGNSTTASDTQTYAVNTTPPAVAISLDADVAGDGVVNLVESTTAAIPVTGTVSGAFKVGDTVTVTVNGKDFTTTVQSGGKFSVNVPGADLAADSDKTVEAKVTTTDSAGNSTTASDTQTYAVNTTPPAVAISLDADVAGDGVVNLVESTTAAIPVTGTVSGAFKVGDTVTVTVNGKDFTTTVQSGGKFSVNVPGADLAADSDKTVEAKVTTTDSAGNSTTASDTQTYAVNTTPPAVAISLDADVAGDGVVNLVESTTAAIPVTGTVSGAFKVGDTVTVTVNGKDFTTTVQSGGKFSVNVPGADLAADSDKTVEAKVTTTDSAGNSTTASDTQTYAVNTTPPAVAISLDADVAGDGVVNLVESTTAAIPVTGTVSGAFKVGDTVTVTVNGKDFTTTVQSGGKFSVNVPGADLAADSDKTVEAKVTTTDSAGNSTTASDTQIYALSTDAPKPQIAIDANFGGDGIINIAESQAGVKVPVTGTVAGDAKLGDTVVVTVNGVDYTTTVITRADGKLGFTVDVLGTELKADADHTIDAKVTSTDSAGNTSTAATSLTYGLDVTPPVAQIAIDANFGGDGIINIAESQAGVKVPVTGTVAGDAKLGDTVVVTVNGVDYTTTVITRADGKLGFTVDVLGTELKADADHTIDAKVTTTDAAGNTATVATSLTYGLDVTPPVAQIAIDANFGGDGIINIAESQAGVKVPVTGTVAGDAKLGDTVVVTVNGVDYTTTVITRADGKLGFTVDVLGTELKADADHTIDAKVTSTDSAGNTSTAATSLTYGLDVTPPVAQIAIDANFGGDGIINIAESQAGVKVPVTGTVAGDAKLGDTVVVTVNGVDYTTTVITRADGKLGFTVDVLGTELKADADHTIDAKVTTTDAAGNTATVATSLTYGLDVTPPVAQIAIDANFGGDGIINIAESQAGVKVPVTGTVAGDAKLGDTVVVTVNGVDYTTTVITRADGKLGFTVDVLGTELKADADHTIDAKVTTTDAAGNTATVATSLTYGLDVTPPVAQIAIDANFGGDGIINIAESQAGVKVPVTGTVGGDAKLGDTVVVTVNGVDYTTTVITRADGKLGFTVDVLGTELKADADHTIDAKVTSTDSAGNTSTAATSLTYGLDVTPPVAQIAIDANFGGDGIINIAESQAGVKVPVTGTVGGDAKLGDTVVVTVNGVDYTTTVITRADGKLGFTVDVLGTELKADADHTIDAKVTTTDSAGNTATVSTSLTYELDVTPPALTAQLDPSSDSGIKGDGITSDNTPTISGTGEKGATVTITMPVTGEKITTTVDDQGKWSVTPTQAIPDGKNLVVTVTESDTAGNTSTTTVPLTVETNVAPVAVADVASVNASVPTPVLVSENFEEYTKLGVGTSVPTGWYTDNKSGTVEVNVASTYGINSSNKVLEIESQPGDGNLYTNIQTVKGVEVTLSFDYSARASFSSGTNSAIQVIVDGVVIDTINTNTVGFQTFTYTFAGTGSSMRVEFKSVDTNTTGGLLDNISISTLAQTTTTITGDVTSGTAGQDSDANGNNTFSVTGVAAGNVASANGNVATSVAGTYGTVTINADGTYIYKLDNTLASTQALQVGEMAKEVFTYTITDDTGLTSSTTLSITVNGATPINDVVAIDDVITYTSGTNGFCATGNVISGAGDATADIVVGTGNSATVTSVSLLEGTLVSSSTTNGVTTIVTTNGTLVLSQDGSYTYTAASTAKTVQNATCVSDYTNAGIHLYGFNAASCTKAFFGSYFDHSRLDLSSLTSDAASHVGFSNPTWSSGTSWDGLVIVDAPSLANYENNGDYVSSSEYLVMDVGSTKSATIELNMQNATYQTVTWYAYDASGKQVDTGSFIYNSATYNLQINCSSSFEYVAITGAAFRVLDISTAGVATSTQTEDVFSYTITDSDGNTSTATLTVDSVTNTLTGSSGNDSIVASTNNVAISGGAGNDTITLKEGSNVANGDDGNDTISGVAGNDIIYGGAGNDNLIGGAGNDKLYGGDGNDNLIGGAGNDTLYSGAGNNTLTGELGSDVFKFVLGDQGTAGSPTVNTITDFGVGSDVLDVRDLLQGETDANLTNYLHFEKSGSDTIIHVSTTGGFGAGYTSGAENQTIVVSGVDLLGGQVSDAVVISNLIAQQKLITD